MPSTSNRKVLLIGWDAADWKVITPLMDGGHMPSLESLVNRGVMGNIATLDPPFSPMLWTSIATGHTADRHGILGFVQPTADGKGIRPVLGTSRQVKAIWNILNQNGKKTNIVGWWPSHPAEPVDGVMVSNFYHRTAGALPEPWPVPPGAVFPEELTDTLAEYRVHAAELTAAHLEPFIPQIAEVDPLDDKRASMVAKMIAEASTTHATATWLMENTEWDFMGVYLDTVDHFGHGFMKYHPPRLPTIPVPLYERYKGAVTACYRFHDMMLGRMLELIDDDTTVILLSDHGFHSDHLRLLHVPKEPAGPAYEHRPHGILVIAGPGIRQDERIYGASLLDITPTLLTLYGLPVGRDMAGKPLAQAFEHVPEIEYIDSWEQVEGENTMHAEEIRIDPWAEKEAMRQLEELGYIDAPEGNEAERVEKTIQETKFYLARVYLSTNRAEEALKPLKELRKEAPNASRYALWLLRCLQELGRHDEALTMLGELRQLSDDSKKRRSETRKEAREKAKAGGVSGDETDLSDPPAYTAADARLDLIEGTLLLQKGNTDTAIEHFLRAEKADPYHSTLHINLGEALVQVKRIEEAERSFHKALTIDPDNPDAHRGLSLVFLRQDKNEAAADAALRAIGLKYVFPMAHLHLGEALMRMGMHERAAQALEVAVRQRPGIRKAHFWLTQLYRQHLDEVAKAQEHEEFMEKYILPAASTS
ncbi:MAG: alkaline phosphatase family protein [Bacteroidetes bacterium]|nr:alkaline phosphatase family protein [Bacteroidota bacterium]